MVRLENQKESYFTLRTVQARKAFCCQYKDRLYKLALNETHNPKQAANLVVSAFQQAFHRYSTKPCPGDCFPFLSASIYLLLATECEGDTPYPNQSSFQTRPTLSAESKITQPGARPYESDQNMFASDRSTEVPRHTRVLRTDSLQPLSQQVFDPDHTEYWMPGNEQGRFSANAAGMHSDRSVSAAKVGAASCEAEPIAPAQAPSSPNISQAYMYNSEIARNQKSPLLSLLNFFLFLLFLWVLIGLLGRMEILPEWNLGYAWFNLIIFPIF